MKKSLILTLLFFSSSFCLFVQAQESPLELGGFLIAGGGIARFELRDAGVSPLFYDGWLPMGSLSTRTETPKTSWSINGTFGYGNLFRTELTTYSSTVYSINHGGDFLKRILDIKPNLHLKVGGAYNGITNIRNTPAFRNAGSTVESINTIFAAARFEFLMDKTKDKRRLLWLIPLKPGRRVSKLNYQLNVPIVNAVWGPTFTYLDDFTDGTVDYDQKNELTWGGFRINSQLNYQYFLRNGNGLQLSYFWDTFSGKESLGQIEFAQHQLQAAVIIRFSQL